MNGEIGKCVVGRGRGGRFGQAANLKRRAPPCVKTHVILSNSLPTLLTLVYRPPIREVDVGLVYGPGAIEVVLVKESHYLVQIALVELPR